MADLIDSMFSFQEEPWHFNRTQDRTKILQDRPTCIDEAINAAGLSWRVDKVPLFYQDTIFATDGTSETGYFQAEGAWATKRSDTGEILGIVGERYNPLQNVDLFEFAEAILNVSSNGDPAKWETAGALAGGKRVWTLLKLPKDFRVGKADQDIVASYMLVTTSHDGSLAFSALITPVRVVCQNTLSAALRNNSGVFRTKHTQSISRRMDEARIAMGMSTKYFEEFESVANALASKQVDTLTAQGYFSEVFPDLPRAEAPRKAVTLEGFLNGTESYEEASNAKELVRVRHRDNDERPGRLRKLSFDLFDHGPSCNIEGTEHTAWSMFNAAAEVQQWQLTLDTERGGRKPSEESHWTNTVLGNGLEWRRTALDKAIALVS